MIDGDSRLHRLRAWLETFHPATEWTLAPASADASFRRYFRAEFADGRSVIVMDAPPDREDCRPFIKVARLLREAGLHAPQVLQQDLEQGFLLLSDLGRTTFLQVLEPSNAGDLFDDAMNALVVWQTATRPGVLPPYDRALLKRELDLFPDWYLGRHLEFPADDPALAALPQVFERILDVVLAQPRVYVHRDYMPRNLMLSDPNPGILDFQDAVEGPLTYDVASLFKDAFLSWPEEQVLDWSIQYWGKARRAGLPVQPDFGDFFRDLEWMGLQRHLKVLGIFARLGYRDGKFDYLRDTPRFLDYVRPVAARYDELKPLARLVDGIDRRIASRPAGEGGGSSR